ncbi:SIR2 family protein [Cellulomonas sp. Sa3CUA2]|uniref:SIR2 family protein n=1 Tax=Cellulomonas avistercoris TaxID=2762242 RepID=A0ABR8QAN3_9CELL|nr:SIR2 family protein [Cellulomonas avistercoris]MBD7917477.1 SIR2 family protein [Cellulomonas avistercoris]
MSPGLSRNLAVLVGNGLSIAYNPELALPSLTAALLERIAEIPGGGSEAVSAMKQIAERALPDGAWTDGDFETLVGAFGAEGATMRYLSNLAEIFVPEDEELASALDRVAKFAGQVRDLGISHVLETIFERSRTEYDRAQGLFELCRAIVGSFSGRITIGNLNYDTLLLSALLETCAAELADMGHGYRKVRVSVGSATYEVPALRRAASDFPSDRRVQLLHLHGSLSFWADPNTNVYAKLDTGFLETYGLWKAVRDGELDERPVVVLANQRDKSDHVKQYPFSLAYQVFEERLAQANYWLIIGYSFRDSCVNERLRATFADREASGKPRVLVATYGASPTTRDVERAMGWGAEDGDSSDWLTVFRDGADALRESSAWTAFSS